MALQDAVTLGQVFVGVQLTDTRQVSSAIQTYEKERIRVTSPLLEKARQGGLDSHAEDQADRLKRAFEKQLASIRGNLK